MLTQRGATLPIRSPSSSPRWRRLHASIGRPRCTVDGRARSSSSRRSADRRLGFVVDELVGQQDIVIKPLGKSLKTVRGFAGATELGDQRVALVHRRRPP